MEKREFAVHIGYPKTGTTLLQKHVYPHLKKYQYLNYDQCHQLFYTVIFKDDLDYRKELPIELLEKWKERDYILASYESLTGPLWYNGLNRSSIPQRLIDLGVTKVLITIRNQVDEIDSCYRQYIQEGGVLPFEAALKTKEEYSWENIIDLDYFNYYSLIQLYVETFGKNNVMVIPSESMKANLENKVNEIEHFIDAPSIDQKHLFKAQNQSANKSLTNASLRLLRITNHFTHSKFKPNNLISNKITTWKVRNFLQSKADPLVLNRVSKRSNFVRKSRLENRINKYYRTSNSLLSKEFDLDLENLGYPVD